MKIRAPKHREQSVKNISSHLYSNENFVLVEAIARICKQIYISIARNRSIDNQAVDLQQIHYILF